jgi:ribosomal protein S18 acetylase RimI-like enzyme
VRLAAVRPGDWADLQRVRLRSLADAPKAFVAEYEHEVRWREDDWRSVIRQARWVLARGPVGVVGVARSSQDTESPGLRYIEAVWVAPEFRCQGIGHALVDWLIDVERGSQAREILLWVIEGNVYARELYLRMGFRSTGRVQPVPGREEQTEELLSYVLRGWRRFRPG